MKKIFCLILMLIFCSPVFGEVEEIAPPAEFEEIEPPQVEKQEETSEETASESSEGEERTEDTAAAEDEVKDREIVIEYPEEEEYKFLHEMKKVYEEQYEKNYLDVDNTLKLAKTYMSLGQRSTAKAFYMQLYNMYPNDPNIQFEMGKFYYDSKQYNAALEFFKLSLASGNLKNVEVNEYTRKTYAKLGDEENELLYEQILDHLKGN